MKPRRLPLLCLAVASTACDGEPRPAAAPGSSSDGAPVAGAPATAPPSDVPGAVDGLPVVYVLATGGTIAGTGEVGALTRYDAGAIEGAALVEAVPQISSWANVHVEQVSNVGSNDIGERELLLLAHRANALLADSTSDVAGIVVTHGTTSLEETAYFLSLTVHSDKPVVVVGSQRPATALSADGPLNLLNAVRVAADPAARGMGALVVMNEQIDAARDVTKTRKFRVEAFQSGDLGVLGWVDADRVVFYRTASAKRHTSRSEFDVSDVATLPRVGIVFAHQDADGTAVEAFVDAGYDGLVLYGFGSGLAPPAMRDALRAAAARIPVVRTGQADQGRVQAGSRDGETRFVPGDNLQPKKARILLQLALLRTRPDDYAELVRIFSEY